MLGVDLGTRDNVGVAWFSDKRVVSKTCTFSEALDFARSFSLIYVDAPLSITLSRKSLEDRSGAHYRDCDKMLRQRGIRFFPITLGPMRKLTEAGIAFANSLNNCFVHETFPGAFYDVFEVPRKSLEQQKALYASLGFSTSPKNQHESDAVACLLTAFFDTKGKAEHLYGRDGCIAIPSKNYAVSLSKL